VLFIDDGKFTKSVHCGLLLCHICYAYLDMSIAAFECLFKTFSRFQLLMYPAVSTINWHFTLYYTYFSHLLTFFVTSYSMAWCHVAGHMASALHVIWILTAAMSSLFLNYMSTFQPRQDWHLCPFIFCDLWIAIVACCRHPVSQLVRPTHSLDNLESDSELWLYKSNSTTC